VIGWQRKGFGLFWSWKIRHGKPGRAAVAKEVRQLVRMHTTRFGRVHQRNQSQAEPRHSLWGAPHIHGELLKLGIHIGESSVGE
jgi:hypothetical protein